MGSGPDTEMKESKTEREFTRSQLQHHAAVGFFACEDGLYKPVLNTSCIGEFHLGRLRLLALLIGASSDDSINSAEGNRNVFE